MLALSPVATQLLSSAAPPTTVVDDPLTHPSSSVIFLGNLLDWESTFAGLLVLIVMSLINNFLSLFQVNATPPTRPPHTTSQTPTHPNPHP